jgi:hypothetical protein
MTAWPKPDRRTLAAASSALAIALLLAGGLEARADEVIRFKNGHSLSVRSSSVEGDTVRVVLSNGSEASFPKSIVKLTETGVVAAPSSGPNIATSFSGRGPRGADLLGTHRAEAMAAMAQAGSSSSSKAVAEGYLNSDGGRTPQTVGFSRWGSDAIGVPAQGSEKAPRVSMATRPQRGGTGEGSSQKTGTGETAGPTLAAPDLMNPADRSHGHN